MNMNHESRENTPLEPRIYKTIQQINPTALDNSIDLHAWIEERRKYDQRVEETKKYNHNLSGEKILAACIVTFATAAVLGTLLYQQMTSFLQ